MLLSQDHINRLIQPDAGVAELELPLDDEEFLTNYVALLKAISVRLSKDTVRYFGVSLAHLVDTFFLVRFLDEFFAQFLARFSAIFGALFSFFFSFFGVLSPFFFLLSAFFGVFVSAFFEDLLDTSFSARNSRRSS